MMRRAQTPEGRGAGRRAATRQLLVGVAACARSLPAVCRVSRTCAGPDRYSIVTTLPNSLEQPKIPSAFPKGGPPSARSADRRASAALPPGR